MRKFSSIAAIAGLLFGYDTGIISGAIFFIKSSFLLSIFMTEIVVGIVLLGAVFGSICSARLINVVGRRNIIEVDAILFMVSTLCSALAPTIEVLLLGRIGVGFAIGIACYVVPLYISELAPARYRGSLVALNTIAVTGGIFISYLIGYLLSSTESWRWMLGLGVVPAGILWFGVQFLPESPRWLVKQGKVAEANKLLRLTRETTEEADLEMVAIQEGLKQTDSCWKELFTSPVRKLLIIGVVLAAIQQVTGINTILYYAPLLFQSIGFKSVSALMLLTLGVGFINFLMTIFVMLRVDKVGRRSLLLWGLFGMTASLTVLSFSLRCNFESTLVVWSTVLSLFAFVAAYASSIGCIFWIVIAEIYPLNVRGLAMGIASAANWGVNLVITLTFLTLLNALGPSNTFFCYCLACAASFIFCYRYLPETAKRSLEEIESTVYSGES